MTKIVYAYAALDGKYIGERTLDDTDRSPISGAWQIPAYMTKVKPPAAKEGYDTYWRGGKWEQIERPKPPKPEPETLDELKAAKILEFKGRRDAEEVENIDYGGHPYDYDQKSRERIHIARQALQDSGKTDSTVVWTTADNNRMTLKVADFAAINSLAAQRSNKLHVKYNTLKERVNAAKTVKEVEKITWESEA
jgi:hypothetical protein